MDWVLHQGDALDLLSQWGQPLDLIVTDPPYAFGGSGTEHAVTATVAVTLRESAKYLKRGCWMVVFCASSWRSISYMVEACRGVVEPVRLAYWGKPEIRTKVRPIGWAYSSVAVLAMRRGPKNDPRLQISTVMDHIEHAVVTNQRRAQLPDAVANWAVEPFAIDGGMFLDPFAGSGALPKAAAAHGMQAHGFELINDDTL